jgi:hypothetical protein
MNRQQKYPETSTFHYYNANPKNKIASDCVIRALCTAMEEPYEKVYRELLEVSLKCGYVLNEKKCYERYLKEKGWVKHSQPRKKDNTKYTGKEWCEEVQTHRHWYSPQMIASIGGHHIVAVMFGQVYDTWDSTNKCIGNYWERG